MKTPSHTIASIVGLYSDEPILEECFDIDSFYGKSYDSWVQNIPREDKNDSTSTSPLFKLMTKRDFCFHSVVVKELCLRGK
jgi:hypothetical protein